MLFKFQIGTRILKNTKVAISGRFQEDSKQL